VRPFQNTHQWQIQKVWQKKWGFLGGKSFHTNSSDSCFQFSLRVWPILGLNYPIAQKSTGNITEPPWVRAHEISKGRAILEQGKIRKMVPVKHQDYSSIREMNRATDQVTW